MKKEWTEGHILPFLKKGGLGIIKNCRGISLSTIAANVYNVLLLNCIYSEIEKILWKNQSSFRRNFSTASQILTIRGIIEGVRAKNLKATLEFYKAFDSICWRKMEQILLTYSRAKETATAMIMIYKNTKAMIRSPDGDSHFFDTDAGVLLWNALAAYLFIHCLSYVLRTSIDLIKENDFIFKKSRSRRYLAQSMIDTDHSDDLTLYSNTPAQAESLLHSQEKAAGSIGHYVNSNKSDYIWNKQKGIISTINSKPQNLVDQFTYPSSNISSTESDVNMRLAKTGNVTDKILIIWMFDLFDKLKRDFLQAVGVSIQLYGC